MDTPFGEPLGAKPGLEREKIWLEQRAGGSRDPQARLPLRKFGFWWRRLKWPQSSPGRGHGCAGEIAALGSGDRATGGAVFLCLFGG